MRDFPAARASSRTAGRCWGCRDARGDRRIAIGLSASFPRKREPMNTGGARDARTVVMGPRLRGNDRGLAGSPSAEDRRAALLVVAVDLHALPHAVGVVGIAAGERIDGGAVPGVDDEHAAARRLAV